MHYLDEDFSRNRNYTLDLYMIFWNNSKYYHMASISGTETDAKRKASGDFSFGEKRENNFPFQVTQERSPRS